MRKDDEFDEHRAWRRGVRGPEGFFAKNFEVCDTNP